MTELEVLAGDRLGEKLQEAKQLAKVNSPVKIEFNSIELIVNHDSNLSNLEEYYDQELGKMIDKQIEEDDLPF